MSLEGSVEELTVDSKREPGARACRAPGVRTGALGSSAGPGASSQCAQPAVCPSLCHSFCPNAANHAVSLRFQTV